MEKADIDHFLNRKVKAVLTWGETKIGPLTYDGTGIYYVGTYGLIPAHFYSLKGVPPVIEVEILEEMVENMV